MGRAAEDGSPTWTVDPVAFEALVRRWEQPIARFIYRVVGRSDRTADLCQDVFLKVYLARERYRENGMFATWLFRIALNVARDSLRRRQFESLPDGEWATDDKTNDHRELAASLAEAVRRLPAPLREVIALRHDQEMSFEAISRVLDIPASTLKSRFSQALRRLHAEMAAAGWSAEDLSR